MRLKMLALKRLTFDYCRCNVGYKKWSMLMENDDVTVHLPNCGTLICSVMGNADKKINVLNICNKWHQFPF